MQKNSCESAESISRLVRDFFIFFKKDKTDLKSHSSSK